MRMAMVAVSNHIAVVFGSCVHVCACVCMYVVGARTFSPPSGVEVYCGGDAETGFALLDAYIKQAHHQLINNYENDIQRRIIK